MQHDLPTEASDDPDGDSVTQLISDLKGGDPDAAFGIWQRYFERLLPLARARLVPSGDPSFDEEDILVSVFDRFFAAAAKGKFEKLNDRHDLWQILVMLTERKIIDQHRRNTAAKRGNINAANKSELVDVILERRRDLVDRDPSPEYLVAFNENLKLALDRLDPVGTREVALMKLEGHSNRDISRCLEISVSTVERKIRVIHEVWARLF